MADATSYTLTHRELITLILKSQKIHEGTWELSVGFMVAVGAAAMPMPDQQLQMNPSATVSLAHVGIQRVKEGAGPFPPEAIFVDAAAANPRPAARKKK